MHPTDHIQIVTFRLAGLAPGDYRAHVQSVAPRFAALPGLRAKTWLADERTSTYGGIYAWRSRAAMEAYLDGPLFGGLRDKPGIGDLETRDFDVLAAPSALPALAPRDSWAA